MGDAGGMVPGTGRPLAQRRIAGPAAAPAAAPDAGRLHGATHCWVLDPPEAPGRWPGLLLRWLRGPSGGWHGVVAYACLRGTEVVLVVGRLDASRLRRR